MQTLAQTHSKRNLRSSFGVQIEGWEGWWKFNGVRLSSLSLTNCWSSWSSDKRTMNPKGTKGKQTHLNVNSNGLKIEFADLDFCRHTCLQYNWILKPWSIFNVMLLPLSIINVASTHFSILPLFPRSPVIWKLDCINYRHDVLCIVIADDHITVQL